MRSTSAYVIATLAASIAVGGCGGASSEGSEEASIRATVERFTAEAGEGNASACALTTGEARPLCGYLPSIGEKAKALTGLTIAKVVVTGSSATVVFGGPSGETMTLTKLGGEWLVSKL